MLLDASPKYEEKSRTTTRTKNVVIIPVTVYSRLKVFCLVFGSFHFSLLDFLISSVESSEESDRRERKPEKTL